MSEKLRLSPSEQHYRRRNDRMINCAYLNDVDIEIIFVGPTLSPLDGHYRRRTDIIDADTDIIDADSDIICVVHPFSPDTSFILRASRQREWRDPSCNGKLSCA